MTSPNERKYGEKPSHPIYVWNGLLERKHFEKIGPAIWLFLWFINAVTSEKAGKGFVLGGAPINCAEIAKGFGINEQTVRAHLERLKEGNYIERTLTPRGYSVRVLNSAKFPKMAARPGRGKTSDHENRKTPTSPTKTPDQGIENPRPNKSKQLDESAEQVVRGLSLHPVWEATGIAPSEVQRDFRELVEKQWPVNACETLSKFMGRCLDLWRNQGGKDYPAAFCKRKSQIAAKEREQGSPQPVRPLPEKPFQKRDWTMADLCSRS